MPNSDPDTAVVACTTLSRHLGLATDVSSTNLLALVVVCKCVCIDGEGEGVGRSRQGLGGSGGMQVRLSPLQRFPKIRHFKRKNVPCIYQNAAKCGKMRQHGGKCGKMRQHRGDIWYSII